MASLLYTQVLLISRALFLHKCPFPDLKFTWAHPSISLLSKQGGYHLSRLLASFRSTDLKLLPGVLPISHPELPPPLQDYEDGWWPYLQVI